MNRLKLGSMSNSFKRLFILALFILMTIVLSSCSVKFTSFPQPFEVSKTEPTSDVNLYIDSINIKGLSSAIADQERKKIKEVFISHLKNTHFFKSVLDTSMENIDSKERYLIMDVLLLPKDEGGFNWKISWPAIYPMPLYWPLQTKKGDVSVTIDCTLYRDKDNKINLSSYKSNKYEVTFYGFFRTKPIEEKLEISYEDAIQDIVRQIVNDKKVLALADVPTNITYSTEKVVPPKTPSSPIIKSDVDELPLTKAKANKNAYAIVIGIEQYRQKLPAADYAVHDAQTVTEYLTKVMGYPEENVVTLTNDKATRNDFEKYFGKWLSNNVEKGGSVFIYYSGHGAPNPKTGDAYLVPYDGDPTFINETGYSLKRLYEQLGKLEAKEIVVALDSCFSGGGGRSVIAKGARPLVMNMKTEAIPPKVAVLSAASGEQISSTYDEKGHGLFTYFMLKGLKGEAETNGSVEIGNLFYYIKPQVERIARKSYNNEQTPQLIAPKELIGMKLR